MIPVFALIGRPNVGKSTLFNRLTRSREALVADEPGLTRDRKYGRASFENQPFILIDTGGVGEEESGLDRIVSEQSWQAIEESDAVFFLVDAKAGLTTSDEILAEQLRRTDKSVFLVVNKADSGETTECTEFFSVALGEPIPLSAAHGGGIKTFLQHVFTQVPVDAGETKTASPEAGSGEAAIRVAIVGKPNVGKSTLVNTLFGEQRVLVFDEAGTTRDSTEVPLHRHDRHYVLIDTAGIRRRARVHEKIEKFSVVKSLQSISQAQVVVFLLDALEGVSDQDASLLGFVEDEGKALVIAFNKTELLPRRERDKLTDELNRQCGFISYADVHFISALKSQGVEKLWRSVDKAYESAMRDFSTPELSRILQQAVERHQPPLMRGHRIKLRYAHQGGKNPPLIVVHGNQTERLPAAYRRYLVNFYRDALGIKGTPLKMHFKTGTNPYAGKKNPLTPRQARRRKRMIKYHKGNR